MNKTPDIVPFSVDGAEYVGDGDDGCYYQVAEGPGGWYFTVVVDSDTGSFVDTIAKDDGPYATHKAAWETGRGLAIEWCLTNHISYDEERGVEHHDVGKVQTSFEVHPCAEPGCKNEAGEAVGTNRYCYDHEHKENK